MEVDLPCQRLFFRGKQLENESTLFDYSINVNDVIQLMIRQPLAETQSENIPITERFDRFYYEWQVYFLGQAC